MVYFNIMLMMYCLLSIYYDVILSISCTPQKHHHTKRTKNRGTQQKKKRRFGYDTLGSLPFPPQKQTQKENQYRLTKSRPSPTSAHTLQSSSLTRFFLHKTVCTRVSSSFFFSEIYKMRWILTTMSISSKWHREVLPIPVEARAVVVSFPPCLPPESAPPGPERK